MSATTEDVRIDLDAIDASKAKEPPKKTVDTTTDAKIDDVVVKTDDTTTVKVDEPEKTDAATIVKPEEGIAKLQKQLDDERALRQDAERRAAEASEGEVQARTESRDTQLSLVTNAIAQVTQSNEILKSGYAEALAAQDYNRVAEIQIEMSTNAAKLIQLQSGKSQLEKAPKITPRQQPDVVEQFVSQLTPTSAAWVRAHPEFVRDPRKNRKMLAAHELAIADGNIADTPGYFASIEKTLEISAPAPKVEDVKIDDTNAMSDAAQPAVRKPAPAAAPVSRGGNGQGSRANVVTLTAEEREIASLNGMTDEEYARNKVSLKKQGRLN